MAFSRYARAPKLSFGTIVGTSRAIQAIRAAVKEKRIQFSTITMRGDERLDTVAGSTYGDGRYWWILAAASDIGWCLQVPAGTIVNVPDLSAVARLVG